MATLSPLLAAEPVVAQSRANQENLDQTTLRAIFTLRKRRWADGQPIRVFVLKDDDPTHQNFVKEKLRIFPYQLRQYWNRVVFSGTGPAPRDFETQDELLNTLADSPDAIGYADLEQLPDGVVAVEVAP